MSLNHKNKEENNREIVPSKVDESLSFQTLSRENLLGEIATKSSEKNEEAMKNFCSESSLFIGARGVVSRTHLDLTVASFPEDACPLRRSEGDVFYQNSRVSVETDCRSQPSSPRG
jgi:hypothetical protein